MAESITVTDNRTGEVEIPITDGGVSADEFRKLLPGVWFYDPAFMTTALTASAITYLDGEAGILRYRGYPIEQLAAHSTYLEVAYPYQRLASHFRRVGRLDQGDPVPHLHPREFSANGSPTASTTTLIQWACWFQVSPPFSTFYPEAKEIDDEDVRSKQIVRLIAKVPTLAAASYRYSLGMPFVFPDNSLSFSENFLSMMWKVAEPRYEPDPWVLSGARRTVHTARRS